jgi:DNA processing protein
MVYDKNIQILLLTSKIGFLKTTLLFEAIKKQPLISFYEVIWGEFLSKISNKELAKAQASAEKDIDILKRNNIGVISFLDKGFPLDLFLLDPNFQPFLYYKGNIELLQNAKNNIGIIGTRNPSKKAIKVCSQIAKNCRKQNYNIVSGFAKGIDTVAQSQSKDSNIIAVPSGLDVCYPKENTNLLDKINKNIEKNLIITPFPLGTKASVENFRERNKIIASIASKLVVVESNPRSGSLMTARYASLLKKNIYIPREISSTGNEELKRKFGASNVEI